MPKLFKKKQQNNIQFTKKLLKIRGDYSVKPNKHGNWEMETHCFCSDVVMQFDWI